MPLQLKILTKTVAATATPELLGASSVVFWSIDITARKSASSANTGNVTIQLLDAADGETWVDAAVLQPGDRWIYAVEPADIHRRFDATQIRLKVATNGDGVQAIIT